VSYIIEHGINEMWGKDKDLIYYISVYNENHPMPAIPEEPDWKENMLKGLYRLRPAKEGMTHTVRLIGSGSIMQQVLAAAEMLEEYGVAAEIWSATNYGELHRDSVRAERHARLRPLEAKPSCHVKDCLGDHDGVTVIASDNIIAYPQLIEKYVGGELVILGTDGFGRSDTREALRRFFEVDKESVTVAALSALSRQGKIPADVAMGAMEKYGLVLERPDITMDHEWE